MIAACTRAYAGPTGSPSLDQVLAWDAWVRPLVGLRLVAVDAPTFAGLAEPLADIEGLEVVLVSPWDGPTPALEALVRTAARRAAHVLLASLEVRAGPADVRRMIDALDAQTLVVGARLLPEHGGPPGRRVPLTGWTTPWNTLALWDAGKLAQTGFLTISDVPPNGAGGGVEEVPTIALHQHLWPNRSGAKLLTPEELRWDDPVGNTAAEAHRRRKLESKEERAQAQLKALGLAPGEVTVL